MKKEFKVQAISEKIEVLEVNGQNYRCEHNCHRWIWRGNSNSKTFLCNEYPYDDAYRDPNR